MRYTRTLPALCLFALGMGLLPSTLRADTDVQRRTKVTLSEPTEIPGTVLPAGTYTVKLQNYTQEKNIVQFLNEDETKVLATVLAIRDRRVRTDDGQTGFIYFQRLEGNPIALKSWYYANDEFGVVFAYPRSKAAVIAKATHEEVVATPAESNPTLESEVTVVKPEAAPKPASEPVTQEAKKTPATLPKTGSDLPLFELIGLGALAAAVALHLARRTA